MRCVYFAFRNAEPLPLSQGMPQPCLPLTSAVISRRAGCQRASSAPRLQGLNELSWAACDGAGENRGFMKLAALTGPLKEALLRASMQQPDAAADPADADAGPVMIPHPAFPLQPVVFISDPPHKASPHADASARAPKHVVYPALPPGHRPVPCQRGQQPLPRAYP